MKIGKQIRGPTLKCPNCYTYMKKSPNILNTVWFWVCPNCESQYEIIEEEK